MSKKVTRRAAFDLSAQVKQSAVNKLLGSVDYPFTVVEKSKSFPGCNKSSITSMNNEGDAFYKYTSAEIDKMFKEAVSGVLPRPRRGEQRNNAIKKEVAERVNNDLLSVGGSIIEQCKKALEVHKTNSTHANPDLRYSGPSKKDLDAVVNGGVEKLTATAGFGLYAWGKYVRVRLGKKPSVKLRSPRIDIKGIEVEVKATAELHASYKWPKCYKWCTKWKWVTKCVRIARATVSVKIKSNSHVNISTKAATVIAKLVIDYLALNYPVLDKINFASLANKGLKGKSVFVYDASKLIAAIPLLESEFGPTGLNLPASSDSIQIEVSIDEIN